MSGKTQKKFFLTSHFLQGEGRKNGIFWEWKERERKQKGPGDTSGRTFPELKKIFLKVNDILRGGIPIPVHPLLRLHRPKVKIQDRALLLLTNVEFNEPLIRQIVGASLDIKRGVV